MSNGEPVVDREKETVRGEVISVGDDGIRVRLDSDAVVLASADASAILSEGDRGLFAIEEVSADGVALVSWVSREPSDELTSFDEEFDELQGALRHRQPAPRRVAEAPTHTLDEERIEAWAKRVTTALTQLHKHRAKRLSDHTNEGT
ncbi:MAG: hypothetical protein NTY63_07105 [Candidatus Bipolaricaulota bacterium]|nr:hypothetical protein [Candidatus Bipolaricaulota bacterium]